MTMGKPVNLKEVDKVIKEYDAEPSSLIGMLQDVQAKYHYLPGEALHRIQEKVGVPLTRVYEVATFYKSFSLVPKGDHICTVCLGTACHLRGGPRIVEAFQRELGVEVSQTSQDGKFTLETVNCLGACAMAPLVKVDEDNHGGMTAVGVKKLIQKYK
ncbi:MAG: NADH dehydrogenase [Deltaproteobacteria bacterium RBG_13_61_14]|nr:MAG: NADH dehydrogenase [Deltaproteobacteria bacterium RBG_13_61_14]